MYKIYNHNQGKNFRPVCDNYGKDFDFGLNFLWIFENDGIGK